MQKIIIALTSYPKRIHIVHRVIKSLWKQKRCANEIILYLSSMEFPHKEDDLPRELFEMLNKNGFRIEWMEGNLKSHKKYYDVLQKYGNDIVITVDDDIEYADTLISDLMDSYGKFPNAISARRARIMLRTNEKLETYQEWDSYLGQYMGSARMDLCAIGAGGILYPPHSATNKWFEKEKILRLAENQDDLWLKYHELMGGLPVAYVKPTQKDQPVESAKESALSVKNVYHGENDICMERLTEYMKQNYAETFSNLFENLMTKEEFISEKKNYYFGEIQKQFMNRSDAPIYLYGAGKIAHIMLRILSEAQVLSQLEAVIVSDKQNNPDTLFGLEVKQLHELDKASPFYVICGVGKGYQPEVEKRLSDYQCDVFHPDIEGLIRYYKE